MRVVFHHRIATRYGQTVHMDELIAAMRGEGHEVIVVGPARIERLDPGGAMSMRTRLSRFLPRWLYELLELGYNVPAAWRLLVAVRRSRPDAIYERYALFLLAGVWVRRVTRVPLLVEVNSPMFEERIAHDDGITLKRLARWAQRATWRAGDAVLPVTAVLADVVRDAGVRDDRITVVPNGIDLDRFSPDEVDHDVRSRLGLEHRVVLGFTGFIRAWHGVDRVVRLLPTFVERFDAHLLVVGDGPARADLERAAAAAGVADRVTITGAVDRDRIASLIAAFDIAIQAGVTPYASPLKLFEYMAMGRAIVAPDAPNIREVLDDGEDAILYRLDDDVALGSAIEGLAGDRDTRVRLGHAARQVVIARGYTWQANARRVGDIVAGLRSAQRRRSPETAR